jgi:hypothetical protein
MSEELNVVKESVIELLLKLMTERVMSERGLSLGVQASSIRTMQESLSTTCRAGPSCPSDEK